MRAGVYSAPGKRGQSVYRERGAVVVLVEKVLSYLL